MELFYVEEVSGIETINARDLHEFLEVGRDFSNWIKQRIEKYGFIENEDFTTTLAKTGERQNVVMKEYHITLDMAKELSMVENNDRGREARQYFIAREKQAKALSEKKLVGPALVASALIEANKMLEAAQRENRTLQIKANVAEQIANAKGLILPADAGKIVCGRPNIFIQWLEDEGILFRRKEGGKLIPKAIFQDRGYLDVISRSVDDTIRNQTYFTGRGLAWICAKYNRAHNLLNFPVEA